MCIYSQLPTIMLIHCVELYLDYENIERFPYLGPNYARMPSVDVNTNTFY